MLMNKPITCITEDATTGNVGFLLMGGDPTGVSSLKASIPSVSGKCFDLTGRRATNRRGLIIDNQRRKIFR